MKILVSSHVPFIPILKKLTDHEIVTLDAPYSQNLANLSIENMAINQFVTPQIHDKAVRSARTVMDEMDKRLLHKSCPISANGTFQGSIFPNILDLCILSYVFDEVKPDVILVHNDVEPVMRVLTDWGFAHSVPVIHIPHSIYLPVEKGAPGDDIHDIMSASHVVVGGMYQAEWFAHRGMTNILPLGLPQFDNLYKTKPNPRIAKEHLGLDVYTPVLAYMSSWRQDTNMLGMHDGVMESYQKLLEVVRALGDRVQLLIKCHPRGRNAQEHVKLAEEAGVDCTITEMHLGTCLEAADLVLCYSVSNVLFEASFFPWLKLACTQGFDDDKEIFKIDLEGTSVIELASMFLNIMDTKVPRYDRFREKYLGYCGDSTEKIVNYLNGTF